MEFVFDWKIVTGNWQNFLNATLITYYVAAWSMLFSMALGLILALLRNSRNPFVQAPARVYVGFFRSLPLYVFLLWLYYGFKVAFGLGLQAIQAAVLALGLIAAAYMSEIYRSGLLAVDRGQYEAGASLGLSTGQLYRKVVLPQVFRTVLPATMNQFVGVLKGATIVGIIGVFDCVRRYARKDRLTGFDTVVMAVGVAPNDDLGRVLQTRRDNVYLIGDCAGAGDYRKAVHDAAGVALKI